MGSSAEPFSLNRCSRNPPLSSQRVTTEFLQCAALCWGLPRTSDRSDSAARLPLSASSARAWSTLAPAGLAPAGRVSSRLSKTWVSIKQRARPAHARSRTFSSSAACAAQRRALLLRQGGDCTGNRSEGSYPQLFRWHQTPEALVLVGGII